MCVCVCVFAGGGADGGAGGECGGCAGSHSNGEQVQVYFLLNSFTLDVHHMCIQ